MDLSLLLTLGVIHSLALISPGPDFAIMVKIATQQLRSTALATAVGISLAILVHTILSLTGVSLLIKSSHFLYLAVQLGGASYLAWMGFGALNSVVRRVSSAEVKTPAAAEHAGQPAPHAHVRPMSRRQGFFAGLYTNLLNPKAMVFFLTLFSALITPEVKADTKMAAALLLLLLSLAWFGFLALVLSKPRVQLGLERFMPAIDGIIGVIFITVAAAIIYGLLG
ncbi:LysE family translocator [Shewanella salipaludis]|uniref:LysE family transporter n=1 Tax=Shewanella salipaludis TaxID=2723052 RepID=A0A972FV27_9GAMM|nr:LysE family transporter [Shewanella salipaludis]NMH66655.1 LysE family transporter [Shewanella salipaludis]